MRNHYTAHQVANPANRAVLPNPHHIPNLPYTPADVTLARANGALPPVPPGGGGGGGPGGGVVQGGGGPGSGFIQGGGGPGGGVIQGGGGGVLGGIAAPQPPPPPPPPHFPFDFWPLQPWQQDPDTSQWPTHDAISRDNRAQLDFLNSWGHFNLQRGGSEAHWHGVKFLGAGGFGCAGLWVQLDPQRNVTDVSNPQSLS